MSSVFEIARVLAPAVFSGGQGDLGGEEMPLLLTEFSLFTNIEWTRRPSSADDPLQVPAFPPAVLAAKVTKRVCTGRLSPAVLHSAGTTLAQRLRPL